MTTNERQKKFVKLQRKKGLLRVSFYVQSKIWKRIIKIKPYDMSWSIFFEQLLKHLVKTKFKPEIEK